MQRIFARIFQDIQATGFAGNDVQSIIAGEDNIQFILCLFLFRSSPLYLPLKIDVQETVQTVDAQAFYQIEHVLFQLATVQVEAGGFALQTQRVCA